MTMPTTVPDVDVYAGDTLEFPTYTITDDADAPLNLSGWTFTAMWRPHPSSETVLPLTVDASSAATGVLRISATAIQTRTMARSGVWDLEGVQGSTVRTFLTGATKYVQDVSRV